jgi:hypothetical protein
LAGDLQGAASHALWHAWAQLEAEKGEEKAVRYLFAKGLEANPRSRYIFLSWALWEKKLGQKDVARDLLRRGATLNRRDPAILQVSKLGSAHKFHPLQGHHVVFPTPCCRHSLWREAGLCVDLGLITRADVHTCEFFGSN